MRRRLVFALVMLVGLAACGTTEAPTAGTVAEPDRATQEATEEPATTPVQPNDLEVGDCWDPIDFTVDTGAEIQDFYSGVDVVPCKRAHTAEVYAIFDLEGAEYPGEEDLRMQVERGCLDAFEEFVGLNYAESTLDINFMSPSRKSWTIQDDRTVICSVYDMYGEQLTGSMEGSQR